MFQQEPLRILSKSLNCIGRIEHHSTKWNSNFGGHNGHQFITSSIMSARISYSCPTDLRFGGYKESRMIIFIKPVNDRPCSVVDDVILCWRFVACECYVVATICQHLKLFFFFEFAANCCKLLLNLPVATFCLIDPPPRFIQSPSVTIRLNMLLLHSHK